MKTSADHRSVYHFAIFMVGLYMVLSLVQFIVDSLAGFRFYLFSEYFVPWYVLTTIISIAVHLILIWYYWNKNYKVVLIAFAFTFVATMAYSLLTYKSITHADLRNFVPGAFVMLLCVGSIYSVSLLISKTKHRRWLFWAGFLGLAMQLIMIALQLWAINAENGAIPLYIGKVMPWILVIHTLTLIFYILNFKEEINSLKNEGSTMPSKFLRGLQNTLGLIALIAILLVLTNAFSHYTWQESKLERSKLLVGDFVARTYVNDQNDTLRYRWLLPKDYNANMKYPLVVNLHNGGGIGSDNLVQMDGTDFAQLLTTDENRDKYPAFIFLPQSPSDSGFGGILDDPGISGLLFEVMESLEQEYNIDKQRRYVVGTSLGGYGSWYLIGAKPEKFAAAIPICGGGDPAMASNMANVHIWAFHGADDKAVPVDLTRDMIKAIKKAGGNPKYTEFSAGHLIWDKVRSTPGILDWLFAQKKGQKTAKVKINDGLKAKLPPPEYLEY